MSYLVDSDWLIDTLRGVPNAIQVLDERSVYGLSFSLITLGEVYEGIYDQSDSEARMTDLRTLLKGHTILRLSDPIVEVFARTRSTLRRNGQLIPDMDLLIASTAIVHDLTLMTRNQRHFSHITDLKLYSDEDDA
ncbi:type II toxin-antitoxin system VapC family toxin [soil metagenome]